MRFYDSPAAEAAAIRRAAALVGCSVESLAVGAHSLGTLDGRTQIQAGGSQQLVGRITCADGWAAARLLVALADEDAATPGAIAFARSMRARYPRDVDFARAVHAMVKRRVAFKREHGELFQSGAMTLNARVGDCDDHARLVYGVSKAGGLCTSMAILHRGDDSGPAHATAVLSVHGQPVWAETTLDARFGEDPNAAARRLGLTNARSDIAKEVVLMSSTENQVAIDARALQLLGYLSNERSSCSFTDRRDPDLSPAVHAFQSAAGILADGLLGPQTRAALAAAVGNLDDATRAGFDYTVSIAGLGDAAPVPTFTHAQARATLAQAYVALHGRDASPGELDFGCAVAFFETGYGRAGAADWVHPGQFARWARDGLINWGALETATQGDEGTLRAFQSAGLHPEKRQGSDAGNTRFFYLFPSDLEAATAFLMSWGKPDTLAAAATGSAFAVASSMRAHGYYEGFHVGPGRLGRRASPPFVEEASDAIATEKDIADYASALERVRRTVTGSGGVPDPTQVGFPGAAALTGIVILAGSWLAMVGAARWWF